MMRTSIVKNINISAIDFSSVFQVGDSYYVKPRSMVLAVQREISVFNGNEGHFNFPIFSKPIPKPIINENVKMNIINKKPVIKVNNINIIGVSTSGIFQVGSTPYIDTENRTKHIRQLIEKP